MERKDLLNILDDLGIIYKVFEPRDGSFFNDETLFVITNNGHVIYMYNFRMSKDEYNDFDLSGETFFITPSGSLLSEAIAVDNSSFYAQDIKDIFLVNKTNPMIDYGDMDVKIMEFYKKNVPSDTTQSLPEGKSLIKGEIIL
jgi:hypothetical protein